MLRPRASAVETRVGRLPLRRRCGEPISEIVSGYATDSKVRPFALNDQPSAPHSAACARLGANFLVTAVRLSRNGSRADTSWYARRAPYLPTGDPGGLRPAVPRQLPPDPLHAHGGAP